MYAINYLVSKFKHRNKVLLTMTAIGTNYLFDNRYKQWTQLVTKNNRRPQLYGIRSALLVSEDDMSVDQLYDECAKYCVRFIKMTNNCELQCVTIGYGSGICVDKRGYFVTNSHVTQDMDTLNLKTMNVKETADKQGIVMNDAITGQVVYVEPHLDLALVRTQDRKFNLNSLPADQWRLTPLSVGEPLVTIGHSKLLYCVYDGYVVDPNRTGLSHCLGTYKCNQSYRAMDGTFLAHNCRVAKGVSGGPVFDLTGKLVAIHFATLEQCHRAATTVDKVREFIKRGIDFDLRNQDSKYKFSGDNRLGISVYPFNSDMKTKLEDIEGFAVNFEHLLPNQGLIVLEAFHLQQSTNQDDYFKKFDIILNVNKIDVNTVDELENAVKDMDELEILVIRNGQKIKLKVLPKPLDVLVL